MDDTYPCEHNKQNTQDVYCWGCEKNKTFMALSFNVAEHIREKLFNEVTEYIDWGWEENRIKSFVDISFNESLQNAVEHGILGIDYQTKQKVLNESPDEFSDFVKKQWVKTAKPVTITLCVNRGRILLGFHDYGKGFDYKKFRDKPLSADNLLEPSGRGIPLLMGMGIQLYWNKKGNSVYCAIMSELLQYSHTLDKRLLKRSVEKSDNCTLLIRDHETKAKLINHCLAGAQIRYIGGSLPVNTNLHITSNKFKKRIYAQVVWNKKVDKENSLIGLKFI